MSLLHHSATVPLGTRAVFCSSALQHCPIRTVSAHRGFFKHVVFAQIPRRTCRRYTILKYAACDNIIHEQISLHRKLEFCPIFAENCLGKRLKIWIPFFLQVINPIATLVYCVFHLIPSGKIHLSTGWASGLILRLSHHWDHCMFNATQFLMYMGTSHMLVRGESLLLPLDRLENICWKTDVGLRSQQILKCFEEPDHIPDYPSTTLLVQWLRLRS